MKLKQIEWKVKQATYAYVGPVIFGYYMESVEYEYVATMIHGNSYLGSFTTEQEARAAVESKIKEWFEQITES